jgi:hypothetical protein
MNEIKLLEIKCSKYMIFKLSHNFKNPQNHEAPFFQTWYVHCQIQIQEFLEDICLY